MDIEVNELWKSVLAEAEMEVSKANFLTLFKPTVLLSFEENVATIAAPSAMIIDLLKRRFYQIIKKSIDKATGKDVEVVFIPKTVLTILKDEKVGPLFTKVGQKPLKLPRVREEYVFENLAVSSSNQLAYVSATTVAKKIGHAYNPLFIYGTVGVGKTHLMQAIANEVFKNNSSKKILYLTSEEFTNEVVEAIRTNTTGSMKKRFRNLDLLIIDDIQFVAGKEKVQEELFHTFNILVDNGSQIVLSSDKSPAEIKKVEKRLLSRFSGGLTVDIQPPDFELRTAILLIKAKKYDFELPIEMAKKIAEKDRDGRSLEGVLLRIITEVKNNGQEISEEIIEKIINENGEVNVKMFRPDEIIKNVCDFYRIKTTQIKGAKRNASLVRARQVAMFLLKKEVGLTFSEIGNLLGGRDHTTIMHGVEKIEGLMEKDKLSEDILGITGGLN
ncbi:MAG: chromosomal replication initiator protein DnaA [Candidatus Levybacteria bacterium RBG_16_35_6]|nr:MAG: chromosomal replication initiator protein DnaA [Candidatus Levybacteria bacterium RBG_16_35_6]